MLWTFNGLKFRIGFCKEREALAKDLSIFQICSFRKHDRRRPRSFSRVKPGTYYLRWRSAEPFEA
jgi:hypothetical protein